MNLRFLKTVIAISQHTTLNAAANSIGLSHSAVSLQIKTLEDELQFQILDRSQRPPVLTQEGHALVERAKRMSGLADEIRALADGSQLHGRVKLGAIPSAMSHLVAPALAQIYREHPSLKIELQSKLSQRLINLVSDGDLDLALVTEPGKATQDLDITPICMEPFKLITSIDETMSDPFELLSTRPFVRFDSRSWVSQQIDTYLAEQKIFVQQALEVDSFEAVESLVGYNLGVSILPIRAVSDTSPRLRHIELMGKPLFRQVALVSRHSSARQSLVEKMTETLLRILAPNQ